jgi:hypothetical protein
VGVQRNLLAKVVLVVGRGVGPGADVARGVQAGLCLCGLCLLASLLRGLLLLHLLVAERRQTAGNLLDLVAGQVPGDALDKLLQEQRVLALLGVVGEQRRQRLAQLGELVLGLGVEDVQRAEVDRLGGVALVGDGNGLGLLAEANVAKELLGLGTGAVKFLLLEPGAALSLSLLLVHLAAAQRCLPVLLDALCLALVVRLCLGLGLGLCLLGLLRLLALDLRVLCGVPRL